MATHTQSQQGSTAPGSALARLDAAAAAAQDLKIEFEIEPRKEAQEINLQNDCDFQIRSSWLQKGWGFCVPHASGVGCTGHGSFTKPSEALLYSAKIAGTRKIRFETIRVKCTKASASSREITELVVEAIEEAFVQKKPEKDQIKASQRAFRAAQETERRKWQEVRERWAAERKSRQYGAQLKKLKDDAKTNGRVTDFTTLCTFLPLRTDIVKFKKATSLLKRSGFQLYHVLSSFQLAGIVKSQSDPALVYACHLNERGEYCCCTQNIKICGGLKGSLCKHLLVLILGLVQLGILDPVVADRWVIRSRHVKSKLNKELMSEIFLKYKGAEAGEVDWRPTETLPEDYYAV
jgi:hypothetical protein